MKFVEMFRKLKNEIVKNREAVERLKKEMAKIKKNWPSHKKKNN